MLFIDHLFKCIRYSRGYFMHQWKLISLILLSLLIVTGYLFASPASKVSGQDKTGDTVMVDRQQRKDILDALRSHLHKSLHIGTIFVVNHLKSKDDWAWLEANPQSADGKNKYEPVACLLQKEKGRWKIIDFAPGECTGDDEDPPDCDPRHLFRTLKSKYNVPPEIFPQK